MEATPIAKLFDFLEHPMQKWAWLCEFRKLKGGPSSYFRSTHPKSLALNSLHWALAILNNFDKEMLSDCFPMFHQISAPKKKQSLKRNPRPRPKLCRLLQEKKVGQKLSIAEHDVTWHLAMLGHMQCQEEA